MLRTIIPDSRRFRKGGVNVGTKLDDERAGLTLSEMLRDPAVLAALQTIKAVSSEYIGRDEVAQILGIHVRSVDNYCQKKILRPLRIKGSRLVRFRRQDVLDLLESVSR
jgi:hypothetical protein